MTDVTRLRAVLRGTGQVAARPTAVSVDLAAFATGLGGGLEGEPAEPCPVVRWRLADDGGHEPYDDGLAGRASRMVSAEGLRVLCGAGAGGDPPWLGEDPTAGLVFLDLETTGLSGGAGTVAFVVGFGWFEGARFHVRQFVLPSFAGERRLLAAVAAALSRTHTVVTFNGKSFDGPFLEMRCLYHGLETPITAIRHLDLLHPARRLWGPDTGGLGGLEHRVLGFRRWDDVSGAEIPSRYFAYLRSGDPAPLRGVLAHNRLDLASLAVLTGLACELVDAGGPPTARDARQCLGLGRVYERGGRPGDAHACYERVAESATGGRPGHPGDLDVLAEALYRVASARRRQRRHADAAELWHRLLELGRTPGRFEREALRALAVHHEHRLKDARRALTFARRAYTAERTASRRLDVQKRLTRLERRLAAEPAGAAGGWLTSAQEG